MQVVLESLERIRAPITITIPTGDVETELKPSWQKQQSGFASMALGPVKSLQVSFVSGMGKRSVKKSHPISWKNRWDKRSASMM